MRELKDAMEAVDRHAESLDDERVPLIAAKCRALLRGYHKRWHHVQVEVESVEQQVESELVNPNSDRRSVSKTFQLAGKIDVICRMDGRRVIFDHKTTSQDIADPNSSFWRQLAVEGQPMQYMLLEKLNGREVDHAMWDVVKKPTISPKTLTKAQTASIVSSGKYCDFWITEDSIRELIASPQPRENIELYEKRLSKDCCHDRPERYFARRAIPKLDRELTEYAEELWQHGQDILHSRRQPQPVRNSGACMLYGSPCKFLGICSGYDTPESDKWQRKRFVHNELQPTETDGRELLTNSRVRCFQTCRRKHFYEYELGIERQDEDEREALLFGTIWHIGLNAWWSSLIPSTVEN